MTIPPHNSASPEPPAYRFRRQGRSARLAIALLLWAALLALLHCQLQASPWIILILSLPALPGLWELHRNPKSGFDLSSVRLAWFTETGRQMIPLNEIDFLRLDTRWDFSTRVTVVQKDGRSFRVPPSATPPAIQLESELSRFALRSERHHFVVF